MKKIIASTVLLLLCSLLTASAADSLEKGIQLARQGKYQEAVQILRSCPQNASNFYYQAYCYYQLKREADAKKLFAYVAENFPRSSEAKLATDFLKRLDPAWTSSAALSPTMGTPASTSPAAVQPSSSRVSSSRLATPPVEEDSETSEIDKLPDMARIYFTPGSNGHMLVDAIINGRPCKCMFDTGAPGLLFGKNHLQQLGIAAPRGAATTSVSGWAGVRLPAWNMPLTVKLGNVERTLNATIQEEFDMPPLIGYAFVKGFQYEVDQKAKCLTLKKPHESQQAVNNLYDLPCNIIGTKPIVPLEIGGRKIPVFIDTGASNTIINAETAAAANIEIPSDAPVAMMGGVGGTSPYRAVTVDLRMGPIVYREFQVYVGGHAGSCVGQDFLQGWRFTVDEKKKLMRFFH